MKPTGSHGMFYVATLISSPAERAVTDRRVGKVARLLPFGRVGRTLNPGVAVEIAFHMADSSAVTAADGRTQPSLTDLADKARRELDGAPIDVMLQREENRRKRLLLADMDSTIIQQECIDELAGKLGLKDHVAAITERAMRGEIAFAPALRERVALLAGLPVSAIDEVLTERVRLTPGARTLVQTMHAHGAHTCLVSGGFSLFTERIAALVGFDEQRANTLVIEGGQLAGRVAEPILGADAKRDALIELRGERRLKKDDTLAVGDGANDLAMLAEAGLGVAFRAKPKVAAAAHARIDHGDLTALLYLQGYGREEFAEVA